MIADYAVTLRFPVGVGVQIQATISEISDLREVIEPGHLLTSNISVTCSRDDFDVVNGLPIPSEDDEIELQMPGAGVWQQYRIEGVIGRLGPQTTALRLILGNPAK
jgi:hypothetical protein